MGFRRFRSGSKRMYQTKQFQFKSELVNASTTDTLLAADTVILGPDQLFGASTPVQASAKRISIVGIDYYFDGTTLATGQPVAFTYSTDGRFCFYLDTLDNAGVPDASGDQFLFVNQVDGTTNQQLFPRRIIDRRQFGFPFQADNFLGINSFNPGISAERRVRRRGSITTREALIFRIEAIIPGAGASASNNLGYCVFGVVTFRVDL